MVTYHRRLGWGVVKTAQETASTSKEEIDRCVFGRTINALDGDDELEQFFECILDFCSSKEVNKPEQILANMDDPRLAEVLIRFWDHTLTSSFVSEKVKIKRLVTCMKFADSACFSNAAWQILETTFQAEWSVAIR
jgi:hypothetical protein